MLCKSGQMVSPPTIKKVWLQRTSAEEINMHPLRSFKRHPLWMTLKQRKKTKTLKCKLWWTDDAWPRFGVSPNTLNVWWLNSPVAGIHVGEQFYTIALPTTPHTTTDALLLPMAVPSMVGLIASNMFQQYESWTVTSLRAANVINWPNWEVGQRQTVFPGRPTFGGFPVRQAPF